MLLKLNEEYDPTSSYLFNPLSAGDAFKRIPTVFPQLKFDRNWTNMLV